MKRVFLTALIVLTSGISAHAQSATPDSPLRFAFAWNPVSYLHQRGQDLRGGSLSLAMRRSDRVSYVADVSIHQTRNSGAGSTEFTTAAYRFGLRYHFPVRKRLKPFAQALAGGANLGAVTTTDVLREIPTTTIPSRNGFAFALGGGMSYSIKPWFSWQAVQVDYSLIRGGGDTYNGVRIHTGAAFHFGN